MTTLWPRYMYREDILRREWWLHIILVVVWGMECDRRWLGRLGGILAQWHSRHGKIKTPKVPMSMPSLLLSVRLSWCQAGHKCWGLQQ